MNSTPPGCSTWPDPATRPSVTGLRAKQQQAGRQAINPTDRYCRQPHQHTCAAASKHGPQQPGQAYQGDMCVTFAASTAAHGPWHGHCSGGADASSTWGGSTFGSCTVNARMLSNPSSVTSVGCHCSDCGSAAAKCATCWPVPLATSSTRPSCGSSCLNSCRIGSLLRSAVSKRSAAQGGLLLAG